MSLTVQRQLTFFHLLRRQMKTTFRKPLVVFTPFVVEIETFLLQSKFYSRTFQETIDDQTVNKADVKKHLFSDW
jgi:2-oxoglutarate dehydrogenase E1 component